MLISVILGFVMSVGEGWHYWDGFVYVAANITGSAYT